MVRAWHCQEPRPGRRLRQSLAVRERDDLIVLAMHDHERRLTRREFGEPCAVVPLAAEQRADPDAVVVRREPSLSANEVLGVFEGRVARYKIPKHVVFVETLPRTALGKVNTAALRQLIAGMV